MIGVARNHPSSLELSRAAAEGLTPDLERHLADCSACAGTWQGFARIDALVLELPVLPMSSEHGEELLAQILATAATKPERQVGRARWIVPAGLALVAAASVVLVVGRGDKATAPRIASAEIGPTYRGAVRAQPGARFVRSTGAPDEVVRLYEGKISVDVTALQAGERFRVVVADAEIEGQGAAFDVVAAGDTLESVQVVQGRIDVRPARRSQVVVIAGQRWEAEVVPVQTTLLEREPVVAEQPVPIPATRPATATATPKTTAIATRGASPGELPMPKLFDHGWKQLHTGDPRAAIETFDDALARYPGDPLAEDVAFWRGVALARAKRSADAIRALAAFADGHTGSPRFGEASAMLGWLLVDAGQLDAAERRFGAARQDPVAAVRTSAEKGLMAVHALRTRTLP